MDPDPQLESLRSTFYEEVAERLAELEISLLELERHADDLELLNGIFRAVHSIKGGAGACDLVELMRFAHAFECLLDPLRRGVLELDASLLEILLESVDVLAAIAAASRRGLASDELEIERALERIDWALRSAGEARPTDRTGAPEMVLWDDEPSATSPIEGDTRSTELEFAPDTEPAAPLASFSNAAPELAAPSLQATNLPVTPPAGMDRERTSDGVASSAAARGARDQLDGLTDLCMSLSALSASLVSAVAEPSRELRERVLDTVERMRTQTSELQVQMAALRKDGAQPLIDGVFVRDRGELYVLPLAHLKSCFSLDPRALRAVPGVGLITLVDGRPAPLTRLRALLAPSLEDEAAAHGIALLFGLPAGNVVLLVDEVLHQGKVLVRSLPDTFPKRPGILGAASWTAEMAVVVDPSALVRAAKGSP